MATTKKLSKRRRANKLAGLARLFQQEVERRDPRATIVASALALMLSRGDRRRDPGARERVALEMAAAKYMRSCPPPEWAALGLPTLMPPPGPTRVRRLHQFVIAQLDPLTRQGAPARDYDSYTEAQIRRDIRRAAVLAGKMVEHAKSLGVYVSNRSGARRGQTKLENKLLGAIRDGERLTSNDVTRLVLVASGVDAKAASNSVRCLY